MTSKTMPTKTEIVPIPEPRPGALGVVIIAAPTSKMIIPSTLRMMACMFGLVFVGVFSTILNSPLVKSGYRIYYKNLCRNLLGNFLQNYTYCNVSLYR
jgi:hypothetical protein